MYEIDKINFLQIGVQGENIARKIEIDMTKWVEDLEADHVSGYSFGLIFKPYNDPNKYPMVTTYDEETHVLTWRVSAAATQVSGVGYTEVRAQETESGLVKKTRIIPTAVEDSVSGNETEPPESQEEWVTSVLNAGAAAVSANTAAQAAKTAAETARDAAQAAAGDFQDLSASVMGLEAGTPPTVDVTHSQGGYYNLAFGIPKGAKGDPAPSDEVVPAVDAYLAANFSNPSNPPLDRSLSSKLSAAPADMAGKMISSIIGAELIVFNSGYINTSGTTVDITDITPSSAGYGYAIVPCKKDDYFLINGKGGNSPRLWAFINDNQTNNRISVANASVTGTDLVLVAPEGATKLVINCNPQGVCYKGKPNLLKQIKNILDVNKTIHPSVIKNNLMIGFTDVNRTSNNISVTGNVLDGITIYGTATANAGIRVFGDEGIIKLKAGKTYLYYCDLQNAF